MNSKLFLLAVLMCLWLIGATQCSPTPVVTEPITTAEISPLPLDGKSLVETQCISCHDMDRIESQNMDADAWKVTVARMVKKGAELSSEDQMAVVEYLAKTYP
ncbi:MAG: hypothetical protein JW908_03800 [Anaerolineales bacterium]|nr:hypothetical protein [Anaerolineales bacterium]